MSGPAGRRRYVLGIGSVALLVRCVRAGPPTRYGLLTTARQLNEGEVAGRAENAQQLGWAAQCLIH